MEAKKTSKKTKNTKRIKTRNIRSINRKKKEVKIGFDVAGFEITTVIEIK